MDTNAFLMPGQAGIDLPGELSRLFGAYRAVTLEGVLRELHGLARGHGRDAAAARTGLALAGAYPAEEGPAGLDVDGQILRRAEETGAFVVTNDRALRERLLAAGIGVVSMRGRNRLEFFRG